MGKTENKYLVKLLYASKIYKFFNTQIKAGKNQYFHKLSLSFA